MKTWMTKKDMGDGFSSFLNKLFFKKYQQIPFLLVKTKAL